MTVLELKQKIKRAILEALTSLEEEIQAAAKSAHDGATHEDAVAKSKYDTHGLELSYLASSQMERLSRLKSEIVKFKQTEMRSSSSDISAKQYDLVRWQNNKGQIKIVFLSKIGAGLTLAVKNDLKLSVVSPESPLGEALLGLSVQDEVYLNDDEEPAGVILAIE